MNYSLVISVLILLASCSDHKGKRVNNNIPDISTPIITDDYELIQAKEQEALLILFPCFPCDAENTRTEFDIIETATANNITVLLMNFNRHLWLSEANKIHLTALIMGATQQHDINTDNTYIGGFSSGGNVSLLLTDYLKSTKSTIQPKGVFIADSPIDLHALYSTARRTIAKDFSEPAVQEANWIVETFEPVFGIGDTALLHYIDKSPYTSQTNSIQNLTHLNDVKVRLYSEPDTTWWRVNRQAEYQDMNAYYIERLATDLTKSYGAHNVKYIPTINRGYRSNGERHPHSWSIIDEKELIKWILSE